MYICVYIHTCKCTYVRMFLNAYPPPHTLTLSHAPATDYLHACPKDRVPANRRICEAFRSTQGKCDRRNGCDRAHVLELYVMRGLGGSLALGLCVSFHQCQEAVYPECAFTINNMQFMPNMTCPLEKSPRFHSICV